MRSLSVFVCLSAAMTLFAQTPEECVDTLKKNDPFTVYKPGDSVSFKLRNGRTIRGTIKVIDPKFISILDGPFQVKYKLEKLSDAALRMFYKTEYDKWLREESVRMAERLKKEKTENMKAEEVARQKAAAEQIETSLKELRRDVSYVKVIQVLKNMILARPSDDDDEFILIEGLNTSGIVDDQLLVNRKEKVKSRRAVYVDVPQKEEKGLLQSRTKRKKGLNLHEKNAPEQKTVYEDYEETKSFFRCYYIGTRRYKTVLGATKTVRCYTVDENRILNRIKSGK